MLMYYPYKTMFSCVLISDWYSMWLPFVHKQSDRGCLFLAVKFQCVFSACFDYVLKPSEVWLLKMCVLSINSSIHILDVQFWRKMVFNVLLFLTEVHNLQHEHRLAQSHIYCTLSVYVCVCVCACVHAHCKIHLYNCSITGSTSTVAGIIRSHLEVEQLISGKACSLYFWKQSDVLTTYSICYSLVKYQWLLYS